MPQYTIKQGDCVSSLAAAYAIPWKKIWNHPNNSDLKKLRKDPNILYPGDVLFIPEKENKEESCVTDQRHRFRKKGTPVHLRLRIRRNTKPVDNAQYELRIENTIYKGKTDNEGWIEDHPISPEALKGRLTFINKGLDFELSLGELDPINTIDGVQKRLANLGFDPGPVDGKPSPQLENALRWFQEFYGMEVSGKLDQATRDKLREIHGS